VPLIIGDMKEAVVHFDRRQLTIKSSDVAATSDINAFEQDMTLWRAIERFDVVARDTAALVNGYIDVTNA
jgi:HK97 family phage major capsid protein